MADGRMIAAGWQSSPKSSEGTGRSDVVNLDWVEEVMGVPGPSMCERGGHDYRQTGDERVAHGKPAAHFTCAVCGREGFFLIGEDGGVGGE